jgi:hypothetical protein
MEGDNISVTNRVSESAAPGPSSPIPAPAPSPSDPSAISYITIADDGLALLYALLAVVSLVQLIRIHLRLPHGRWTTQKNFLSFNLITACTRSVVFACRSEVENVVKAALPVLYTVLLDGPGLLFFSTFTLLILFWAEIYYQATVSSQYGGSVDAGSPGVGSGVPVRPRAPPQKRVFILVNVLAYLAFAGIAMATASSEVGTSSFSARQQAAVLFLCLAVVSAYLFLLYGARLFTLLRRFPIDSRGRRSKLREIGLITGISCSCFLLRSFLLAESLLNAEGRLGGLDVMSHPVLNGAYYMGCEVLPMAWVMYVLRKLPPKVRDVDGRGVRLGRGGQVHVADGGDGEMDGNVDGNVDGDGEGGADGDVGRAENTDDVESMGADGDHTLEQPLL